jgi:hypothetical protein
MGLTRHAGHYKIPDGWIPEEHMSVGGLYQSWRHVEDMLTRFGLPGHVIHNEDVNMKEKMDLLLFLSENVNVQTFISHQISPLENKNEQVQREQKTQKAKQNATPSVKAREELDLDLPPTKKPAMYSRRKSLHAPSSAVRPEELSRCKLLNGTTVEHYWQTLGSIHTDGVDFEWGEYIGFRSQIGRAYYDSFTRKGKKWQVGDFIWMKEGTLKKELYRIVSAFQAMKSFIGKWINPDDELQKRGTLADVRGQLVFSSYEAQ